MEKLTYEQFVDLLKKYEQFDYKLLDKLFNEFGKSTIKTYFKRYYDELEEDEAMEFSKKYSVLFEKLKFASSNSNRDLYTKFNKDSSLMTKEEEYELGLVLEKGRKNLTIINETKFDLYPKLNLEKIFLSLKNKEDLDLIKKLLKLPYVIEDDMLFLKERDFMKKYLSFNKILTKDELKKNFPNFSFENVEIVEDISKELKLLKDYIIAKKQFFIKNIGLVYSSVKVTNLISDFKDKMQEGYLGLISAINNYNSSSGYRFSTYAIWKIRGLILLFMADNSYTIRKPYYLYEKIRGLENFIYKYISLNGVEPSVSECAIALGKDEKEILELMKLSSDVVSFEDIDLDELLSDSSFEEEIANKDFMEIIYGEIDKCMSITERMLFDMHLGFNEENRPYSFKKISAKLNIGREFSRRSFNRSMKRLVLSLEEKGVRYYE